MDKELIEVLCCPDDKGDLTFDKNKNILICKKCIRNFKIDSGIPIMFPKDF
jgi:hypothetical protein